MRFSFFWPRSSESRRQFRPAGAVALSRAETFLRSLIVGAGSHGLATADYMAKDHGLTRVAVVEKGRLGGGDAGCNTTIIRLNYL